MFISTGHDLRVLGATLGFNIFVMGAFGAFVASTVSKRVEIVAGLVETLSQGEYEKRIDAAGNDELSSLAVTVNNLAQQLESAERAQAQVEAERRDLTAAVSHDLRTPLASIRAMVEALADGIVSDEAEAGLTPRCNERSIG